MSSNKEFVHPRRVIQTNPNGVITDIIKGGITLRDYFAAKAMQGMIAQGSSPFFSKYKNDWETDADRAGTYEENLGKFIALSAYRYADAMLAEREKNQ